MRDGHHQFCHVAQFARGECNSDPARERAAVGALLQELPLSTLLGAFASIDDAPKR